MSALLAIASTAAAAPPIVNIPGLGSVIGVPSNLHLEVNRFFALPYALPPIGPLRWASPKPHGAFVKSPLNGTVPGNACMQKAEHLDYGFPVAEDCLTLNIATPAHTLEDVEGAKPLPVMVWFHGGAFAIGAGANYRNDALVHASGHSVVVVTLNYRLHAFGFLGSAELAAEGGGSTGNYGIEDQRLALYW